MTRTIIFSFLIFVVPTAVQTLEEPLMTFDNRNSVCYGPGTHGHFRPSCYDENSLMAIRNLKAGAKPLAKGCPGSVTKWTDHSGSYLVDHMDTSKILDESACCIPDYSQDCIFDFNYANSGLSYFYHVSCSGYSECKPNMDVSWQLTSCNNSSIYPSGTNYMFMEYSCINRTKIVNMCSNKSHTASSGTVYLTTPNYPESLKPDIDVCKCHIQTNGTKLSFYSIDVRLYKFGNDCKQSMNVTDSDGATVWDCESAPKFNITNDTFNAQATVTINNYLIVDGGQAWIGFSGGEGNILTINCQNEQTSDSTTPFQRTSSTDNITTTSFSRTETTVSPTSEPTSLSGRRSESQSPITNQQMSSSSMTNPNENGFTESTIKDQNGWSNTTVQGQNGLNDSTIKDGNDLTVSTSKYQSGLTESTRIENTFSGERFTTTKTQTNTFQQTINVEIADKPLMYAIIGISAGIFLLLLILLIFNKIKAIFVKPNQIHCSTGNNNNQPRTSLIQNDRPWNQGEGFYESIPPGSSPIRSSGSGVFSEMQEMNQAVQKPSYSQLGSLSVNSYESIQPRSSPSVSGSNTSVPSSVCATVKKTQSNESQKQKKPKIDSVSSSDDSAYGQCDAVPKDDDFVKGHLHKAGEHMSQSTNVEQKKPKIDSASSSDDSAYGQCHAVTKDDDTVKGHLHKAGEHMSQSKEVKLVKKQKKNSIEECF
ncbi:uncharacterized protein LOC132745112 isoform X4 [Ruditapes philippinarum]|uniref:uncharacterized protein LOC132745112 isoform X4 n=1 Tax=Ruditapes philippinarum TaxID=129788 RepID=UPI00295B3445|nr:uncharacterized protein LOC132745112 isoform X4 [Ruditapes philippinarum]